MTLKLVKVFGERNTASRAVIRMIDAAPFLLEAGHPGVDDDDLAKYDVMIDQVSSIYAGPWKRVYREAIKDLRAKAMGPLGMWKHAAPDYHQVYKSMDVGVLFLARNPYSWIQSLNRRPYHCMGRRQQDLEEFLVFPWLCLGRDNIEPILSSPMYLWSRKLAAYQQFREKADRDGVKSTVMRFEDFVQNPVLSLNRALLALEAEPGDLRSFPEATKPEAHLSSGRKQYYLNEEWRQDLTSTAVSLINDMVDWTIADRLGYTRLDPADFPDVDELDRDGSDRKRGAATAA